MSRKPSLLPKQTTITAADGSRKTYYYDRLTKRRLTDAEVDALQLELANAPAPAPVPSTNAVGPAVRLGTLIDMWRGSSAWAKLAGPTRRIHETSLSNPAVIALRGWRCCDIRTSHLARLHDEIAQAGVARIGKRVEGAADMVLSTLASLWSFGLIFADLGPSPVNGVRRFGVQKAHTPWANDDIAAWLAVVPSSVGRCIRLGLVTAMRLSDIHAATWSMYDPTARTLTWTPSKTSRSTGTVICIDVSEHAQTLDAWRAADAATLLASGRGADELAAAPICPNASGTHWAQKVFHTAWSYYRTKHALPDRCMHGLRATVATRMIEGGVNERDAMTVTGHSSSKAFSRYVQHLNAAHGSARATTALRALIPASLIA